MSPDALSSLARRWRWRTLARDVLLVLGAVALGLAAVVPWTRFFPWLLLVVLGTVGLLVRVGVTRPWRIGPGRVAGHLDRAHPELEESCGLLLRAPGPFSAPERLQRQRLEAAWAGLEARGVRPGRRPPVGFWQGPLATVSAGVAALTLALAWRAGYPRSSAPVAANTTPAPATAGPKPPVRPRISAARLEIVPPAYTGHPPRTVAGLDAEVEEGATVTWSLQLDGPPVREVRVGFGEENGGDELSLRVAPSGTGWEGPRLVGAESGLYHVTVRPAEGPGWRLPDVGSLKVIPDATPVVTILQPTGPRTELEPAPDVRLPVEARVTDDYGVQRAWLVATVAKGSGEGVKFRERRVEFDPPASAESSPGVQERRFAVTLDFAALGMEPGDEVYFHVEAEDNHPPTPHLARSETRFVALRGPASAPVSAGRGVAGVNLVPAYFRSERQIILDTERLLAERPGLSEREFRRRSEDLGADQALLRLRYGQFVGEESEAGVGGGGDHTEVNLNPLRPGVPAGVPADLVHQHDQGAAAAAEPAAAVNDPRAGLRTAMRLRLEHADQARGGGAHDAAPAGPDAGLPPTAGQIVAPYVDQHDSQEKATFFDHGTKTTLRGVLAAMWSAEGLLRTGRPGEALAPEHLALEGLKELQQGERLYVQRVGFEPTPLRVAERRARGDVADVPERAGTAEKPPAEPPALAGVRVALAALPGGENGGRSLTDPERTALGGAAGALGEAAAREGGTFLGGLRALRRLETGETVAGSGDLEVVRSALLRLLPPVEEHPVRPRTGTGEPAEGPLIPR